MRVRNGTSIILLTSEATYCYIDLFLLWTVSVINDFETEYYRTFYMDVATDNSIVLCGEPYTNNAALWGSIYSLSRYSLEKGNMICSIKLKPKMKPKGVASVTLAEQNCVAMSYQWVYIH